jgi:RimJ/RimL family protein N-acetyltransferase
MSLLVRRLETLRLSLEPVVAEDQTGLRAHWMQPGVRRYLWDGNVVTEEEVRKMIESSARQFEGLGVGLWAVRESGAPGLIGCAGFWYFHEPPELELVYSLSEAYWGRGLGRECVSALIQHVFDDLDWTSVQASADAPNAASLQLMRALGMQPFGRRPGAFGAIEVFRMTRREWRTRAAS